MKRFSALAVIFSTLFVNLVYSQSLGSWETYFSYEKDITHICEMKGTVFALTDGKLFSYNPSDGLYEIFTKSAGGNVDIQSITYNKKTNKIFVLRQDYDIDLLDEKGNLFNISVFKNTTQNVDKTVNSVTMDEEFAYLNTNFGLLIVDMAKGEVRESCVFNFKVYSSAVFNNMLYISSEKGIMSVGLDKNIIDVGQWTKISISDKNPFGDLTFSDNEIRELAFYKGKLHMMLAYRAIYIFDIENNALDRTLENAQLNVMKSSGNDGLIAYGTDKVAVFTDIKTSFSVPITDKLFKTNLICAEPKNGSVTEFWVGVINENLNLIKFNQASNTSEKVLERERLKPDGPVSNYAFSMTHDGEKMMYVGGRYFLDRYSYDPILGEYKDGRWFNYDKDQINSQIRPEAERIRDFTAVVSDPLDRSHLFVSSWGEGLVEFRGHKCIKHLDDIFIPVLPVETDGYHYFRLNGMSFDKQGNLWVMNTNTKDLLTKIRKDGTTFKPYANVTFPKTETARCLKIDKYNKKWLVAMRHTPFIMVVDDKGDENDVNDVMHVETSFKDQDNNAVALYSINDITEDHNGNMWLSTDRAPYIIYNTSRILNNKELIFNKIKIPRNDGTNNADILLENTNITTIAVDGANRKWIATDGSGVYLVSENGQESIHHFNTQNSALPSNLVLSLAIDQTTGIVYMGTDRGIVSFKGDAIEGSTNYSNVSVYPNPVRPEYDGVVAISGLMNNSNVKITDVRGNLINQGKSLGGQYTWDVRNVDGTRVSTGTYLVFGSSEDGATGVVTKVLVVSQ